MTLTPDATEKLAFLGYVGDEGQAVAEAFRLMLQAVLPGWRGFCASEHVIPGQVFRGAVEDWLARCHAAVFFVTEVGAKSPWLFFEAGWLEGRNRTEEGGPAVFLLYISTRGETLPDEWKHGPWEPRSLARVTRDKCRMVLAALAGGAFTPEEEARFERAWTLFRRVVSGAVRSLQSRRVLDQRAIDGWTFLRELAENQLSRRRRLLDEPGEASAEAWVGERAHPATPARRRSASGVFAKGSVGELAPQAVPARRRAATGAFVKGSVGELAPQAAPARRRSASGAFGAPSGVVPPDAGAADDEGDEEA